MEIFDVKNSYLDDKNLKKDLNELNELTNKKLDEMSVSEINRMVFLHERSSISLRHYLETSNKNDDEGYYVRIKNNNNLKENHLENLPVTIEKNREVYHIFMPYTFKKGLSESYGLANYLRAEIIKKRQEGMDFNVNGKQLVVALRVGEKFVSKRYRDNDNMETTELINVIFSEGFVKSDNALNMSFVSDFMLSNVKSEHGFHLFVLPYSMLELNANMLMEMFRRVKN